KARRHDGADHHPPRPAMEGGVDPARQDAGDDGKQEDREHDRETVGGQNQRPYRNGTHQMSPVMAADRVRFWTVTSPTRRVPAASRLARSKKTIVGGPATPSFCISSVLCSVRSERSALIRVKSPSRARTALSVSTERSML